MKKILLLTALLVGLAFSYCEYGSKISEDYNWQTQKKIVIYDFGQGRVLSFKFYQNQSVPYQMRYDFYKDEVCY